ncbi:MAG: hypothetical protein CMO44_05275 [Verrucomicrobiales bacterium]|nr:hypothetical protein [Verrucomicrobiales bacterium]|tara:strand:+ start:414 stop:632 length:219 start_codon:yes stop_codon:yes gene_type:complete
MNSKEFSLIIEDLVKKHRDMSYMDAIIHYCEENNVEVESAAKMLTKQIKEKIQFQSQKLNLIKGPKPGVLPG